MSAPEKIYLIDTNVILRFLLFDHPVFSQKAKAFMIDVYDGERKAEILPGVILECIYVLGKIYNVPKAEIADRLIEILNFSGVVNKDKSDLLEAFLKFKESGVDFMDCLLSVRSSPDRPVVSFDKDLRRLEAFTEDL